MKNKRIFLVVSIFALVVFSAAALPGCRKSSGQPEGAPPTVLLDQEKMNDPGAKSVKGKTVKISDYKGKPLVLNFWAPWCPPCKAEAPALQRAYNYYKDKNVQFLMVSIKDADENVVKFMKDEKLNFPVALDTDAVLASYYEVTGIPTTFFIKSDGQLSRKFIGQMSEQQIASFIEEIV